MARKRTEEEWETHVFPSESKFQEYVMKRLRSREKEFKDIKAVKVNDSRTPGIPDILICARGFYVAIELKQPGNYPTALQKKFLEEIREAKGVSCVAYNWKDVKDALEVAGICF